MKNYLNTMLIIADIVKTWVTDKYKISKINQRTTIILDFVVSLQNEEN